MVYVMAKMLGLGAPLAAGMGIAIVVLLRLAAILKRQKQPIVTLQGE